MEKNTLLSGLFFRQLKKIVLIVLIFTFSSISFAENKFNEQKFLNNIDRSNQELKPILNNMNSDWFSNEQTYKQNLQDPLMSNSYLYTLDRKKSGKVQLMCPGKKDILRISVQPSPTRDLSFINISYDSNLDGQYDNSLNINGPVSGICANGFIKCIAGSWNNCNYYKWNWNKQLSYTRVPLSELASCFCINSSCTKTSFMAYKDQILMSIGGGIVDVLTKINPGLAVSQGSINNLTITYNALNAKKCNVGKAAEKFKSYGYSNPEDLTSAELNKYAEQEILSQKNDEESPYYILTKSNAFTKSNVSICTKTRNVYFDYNSCKIVNNTTDNCLEYENDPNCVLKEEKVYDRNGNFIYTVRNYIPTGITLLKTCYTPDTGSLINCALKCKGNIPVTTDGGCPIGIEPGKICYSGHIQNFAYDEETKTVALTLTTAANGCKRDFNYPVCGSGHIYFYTQDDPGIKVVYDGSILINHWDHSSSWTPYKWEYDINSGSEIKYIKAHGEDSGSCNTAPILTLTVKLKLHTDTMSNPYCYDWWRIERTYVCKNKGEQSIDLRRTAKIDSSLTETSSGVKYNDLIKQNDSWVPLTNQKIDFKNFSGETCIPACKVTKIIDPAQVAASGCTTSVYRKIGGTQLTIYRKCINNTCPVYPGEKVVQGCMCINDFARVLATSEALRFATNDMICSDGKEKSW